MKTKPILLVLTLLFFSSQLLAQSSYSSPATGEKVLGTYFSTDVDNVDIENGNLHIARGGVFHCTRRTQPGSRS